MTNHKFYISIPGGVETEFDPLIDDLVFQNKKYKEECFFREEIGTSFTINDIDLFGPMIKADLDRCICNVADIRITEECCGEETDRWIGTFPYKEGEWDADNCQVSFTPNVSDEYDCLIERLASERNFFDIQDRVTIQTLLGKIEIFKCLGTVNAQYDVDGELIPYTSTNLPPEMTSCIMPDSTGGSVPSNQGWIAVNNIAEYVETFANWRVETTYAREFVAGSLPTGTGWVAVAGGYAREVGVASPKVTESTNGISILGEPVPYQYQTIVNYKYVSNKDVDNGIRLRDFVEHFMNCDCLISNFFGINPDNTNPQNDEYANAEKYIWNAVIFQASDIINVAAINSNATGESGFKKVSDCWEDLKSMFELCIWFDHEEGCMRIEHNSYRRALEGIDLTSDELSGFVRLKYKYKNEDLPKQEKLKAKVETNDIDFDDGFINYEGDCTAEGDSKEKSTKVFVTNFNRLYDNEDYEGNDNARKSIVLVSVDDNDVIYNEQGHKTGQNQLNAPFSFANIVRDYWTNERPFCFGNVNAVEVFEYENVKKIKALDKFTLPITCDQYKLVNPETTRAKFKLGEAQIEGMEYSAVKNELEIESIF